MQKSMSSAKTQKFQFLDIQLCSKFKGVTQAKIGAMQHH